MISSKLIDDLRPYLDQAKEVCIAVALMKDSALDSLQQIIPKNAKQRYLVGIDLPTTPSVLRILKSLESKTFEAGIFKTTKTFHPKVYIINDGSKLSAFVGSGNLTDGGLSDNIEMSLVTHDQEVCNSLREWFNNLYSISYPLSDENIEEYESHFKSLATVEEQSKVARTRIKLKKAEQTNDPLKDIDFSNRYFSYDHHAAFRPEIWRSRAPGSNDERHATYEQFYDLNRQIFPLFKTYGLSDLSHHKTKEYIVSHYFHADGFTSNELSAMWLSYGKKQNVIEEYQNLFPTPKRGIKNPERESQSFINHARLQIIIHHVSIGIWLFYGKKNGGSKFDRDHFKRQMNSKSYRDRFFKLFKDLPHEYFISLNDNDEFHIDYFQDSDSLHNYCKRDDPKNHFIIGRNYKIEDDAMSLLRLPMTVLEEFQRLHPLYDMMRDKTFG